MITNEFRPKTFDEMAGQSMAKVLLKSIVDNPVSAPKTLIFYGEFGTGKTTSARVFARALNCRGSHKPCMKCESCLQDIEQASYYREYDSSIMGRVEKIRELRDTFYVSSANGWQVIVFDEVHLVSAAAQGALLKILEETPPRTFFILSTTDVDKLLNTIRSRALEVKFDVVPLVDVQRNVRNIFTTKGINVSDKVVEMIAKKSKGHMRNAHKFIDQYILVGEEQFSSVFKSSREYFIDYFTAVARRSNEEAFNAITQIIRFPLAEVKDDFRDVVLQMSKQMVGLDGDEDIKKLVTLLNTDVLRVVKLCISDWVLEGFESDMELQTTLLCIYQFIAQSSTKPSQAKVSIYDRAARR